MPTGDEASSTTERSTSSAPAAAPLPRDGENPTGRTLDYQQPVGEHTKSHCMNPRLHAAGECGHEDITILDYVRGPADAPLRLPRDVVERIQGNR